MTVALHERRTVHKELGNERVGIYELSCTKCKRGLHRTSAEAWWWQPQLQYGDNVFKYRQHADDEGVLDLRYMWCECRESDQMAPLHWIWHRLPILERTFKLTVHTNNETGTDLESVKNALLERAMELGVALTITLE